MFLESSILLFFHSKCSKVLLFIFKSLNYLEFLFMRWGKVFCSLPSPCLNCCMSAIYWIVQGFLCVFLADLLQYCTILNSILYSKICYMTEWLPVLFKLFFLFNTDFRIRLSRSKSTQTYGNCICIEFIDFPFQKKKKIGLIEFIFYLYS